MQLKPGILLARFPRRSQSHDYDYCSTEERSGDGAFIMELRSHIRMKLMRCDWIGFQERKERRERVSVCFDLSIPLAHFNFHCVSHGRPPPMIKREPVTLIDSLAWPPGPPAPASRPADDEASNVVKFIGRLTGPNEEQCSPPPKVWSSVGRARESKSEIRIDRSADKRHIIILVR